jgi:ribosome-associated protein
MTLSPERLATTVAAYAADKKASVIVVLDLREVAGYTDFFVIVSGTSDRQAKAIHDGIHLGL